MTLLRTEDLYAAIVMAVMSHLGRQPMPHLQIRFGGLCRLPCIIASGQCWGGRTTLSNRIIQIASNVGQAEASPKPRLNEACHPSSPGLTKKGFLNERSAESAPSCPMMKTEMSRIATSQLKLRMVLANLEGSNGSIRSPQMRQPQISDI